MHEPNLNDGTPRRIARNDILVNDIFRNFAVYFDTRECVRERRAEGTREYTLKYGADVRRLVALFEFAAILRAPRVPSGS